MCSWPSSITSCDHEWRLCLPDVGVPDRHWSGQPVVFLLSFGLQIHGVQQARLRGELDDAQRQQEIQQAPAVTTSVGKMLQFVSQLFSDNDLKHPETGQACCSIARRTKTERSWGGVLAFIFARFEHRLTKSFRRVWRNMCSFQCDCRRKCKTACEGLWAIMMWEGPQMYS